MADDDIEDIRFAPGLLVTLSKHHARIFSQLSYQTWRTMPRLAVVAAIVRYLNMAFPPSLAQQHQKNYVVTMNVLQTQSTNFRFIVPAELNLFYQTVR